MNQISDMSVVIDWQPILNNQFSSALKIEAEQAKIDISIAASAQL